VHPFLSAAWFSAVDRIRSEAGELNLPASVRELIVNIETSDGPEGEVRAHLAHGALQRGFSPQAATTLRMQYRLAHQAFVSRDHAALVRAYMAGELRVEGDVMRLLALRSEAQEPELLKLLEQIEKITI